jgi:PepSY-associated TM region
MSALWSRVNRWLVWFHRWAGVALCLLVVAWFASGAIVHFVPYPALSREEQLARAEPLALPRVRVDPETALEQMPRARDLRLLSILGRPVYVGRTPGGTSVRVAADTGEVLPPLSADAARTVAARFFGASAASVTGPLSYDQWIVHQHFDPYRPLFRVRMNDADRTDVYVSAVTGEVVQRTRFSERAWNWPGAVLHWLYFTPLRKDWSMWNQSVWWISLITLLSATVGAWLGTVRLIANRSAGRPGLSPFRGWMRWHHIVGLFASVIVLGWILSGWLSMDHGRIFSRGQPTEDQAARVSGMTLAAAAAAATAQSLRDVGRGVEISLHAVAGRPFLTIYDETAARSRVLWLGSTEVSAALPDSLLATAVRAAWSDAVSAPPRFDDMYRLAEHLPPSARGFVSPRGGSTRIYVDPLSGEVLAVMDPGRRTYAWIYYALHTLNFPGLLSWPLARTVIEMALLAAGLAFGVTGIILAFRRLRQELRH